MAIYNGKGIVWNPKKNRKLWNFNNGPYTTTDKDEQELLRKNGFVADFEDEIVIMDDEEIEEDIIRSKAKELGIANYWNKNIDKLKLEIEVENE